MKVNAQMITQRQFLIMAFIGGMVIKGFMLPSLLMPVSGRDGIFVMIFYFIVEIINLAIIAYLITAYPDKTFFVMLEECFGKIISRILIMIFIFAATVKLALNFSEVKNFFVSSLYSTFKWEVMIIPLIAVCFVLGIKSLRVLGRSAEIFFPFIVACIVLLSLILFQEVPVSGIFPLFENGIAPILDGIGEFPIWFGDVIFLSVAMGHVKRGKHFILYAVIMRVIVAVMILALATVMFATYANIIPLIKYGHNITSLTQYNLGSQEYGRFDLIIYSVWLFGVFLKMAMNFYFGIRCIAFLVNSTKYKLIGAVQSVVIYILGVFIFPSVTAIYSLAAVDWVKYLFCFTEYLMPVVTLIAATIRYRKGNGTAKQEALGEQTGS